MITSYLSHPFIFHLFQCKKKPHTRSVSNGKYLEDMKYSNMHTVSSLDEPKYTTNCHVEDHSIKQPQQYTTTTNLTVGGCHTDDVNDNNMTVIKSEDGNVSHSYVLPPFLH